MQNTFVQGSHILFRNWTPYTFF